MKQFLKQNSLLIAVLLSGLGALLLRLSLYRFFLDRGNLLPRNHPAALALWLLTALTGALVFLLVRRRSGSEAFEDNFRDSLPAAFGHILLASGILLTVLSYAPAMAGAVGKLWKLLGVASAPLLFYAGFARVLGKKPFFVGYVVVSVFFALHLVCHYRSWCSDPQLQNYVFSFAGAIGLMLFGYYQAAMCVGRGSRRHILGVGLMTAYLCMASLANTQYLYLYLGGATWTLTGLCRMEPGKAGERHAAA